MPGNRIQRLLVCRIVLAGVWAWGVATASAAAQVIEAVGVRALGMGGAFVAVADDATATYWNPAGLATGPFFSLAFDRQWTERLVGQLPGGPDEAGPLAATGTGLALAGPPLGLSYYRIRVTEVGPSASSSLIVHQTGLTTLQTLAPGVVVGTTIKLVRGIAATGPVEAGRPVRMELEEAGRRVGLARNALDLDVGLMAGGPFVRGGLVVRNVRRPGFEAPAGDRLELQRQVRAGLAVFPAAGTIVAADLDLTRTDTAAGPRRNLAIGAERQWGRLALRGGARASTAAEARPVATLGISLAPRGLLTLEAQVTRGHREGDRSWGVGGRLAFW